KIVVIDLSAVRAERIVVPRFLPEIERTPPGIVEKNSISRAVSESLKKRNRLVERVARFLPAKFVRIPHRERTVPAIHRPGLVTQSKITFVRGHFLPHMNLPTLPGHRQTRFIRHDD